MCSINKCRETTGEIVCILQHAQQGNFVSTQDHVIKCICVTRIYILLHIRIHILNQHHVYPQPVCIIFVDNKSGRQLSISLLKLQKQTIIEQVQWRMFI